MAAHMTWKRWKRKENKYLVQWWGVISLKKLAKDLGRTEIAVYRRGIDLGLGAPSRGLMSMDRFVNETGYARSRIMNAAARLGMKIRRRKKTSPLAGRGIHRAFVISDTQQAKLLKYLASVPDGERVMRSCKGEWGTGKKPKKCVQCHSNKRPHVGRGLCASCYDIDRRPRKGRRHALPIGAWGVGLRPTKCIAHGKTDRPHYAAGYCKRCYSSPVISQARAARRAQERGQVAQKAAA